MTNLWWEDVVDWSETCKDLEWFFYNGAGLGIEFPDPSEELMVESGPISEQIWAMREGLA